MKIFVSYTRRGRLKTNLKSNPLLPLDLEKSNYKYGYWSNFIIIEYFVLNA